MDIFWNYTMEKHISCREVYNKPLLRYAVILLNNCFKLAPIIGANFPAKKPNSKSEK